MKCVESAIASKRCLDCKYRNKSLLIYFVIEWERKIYLLNYFGIKDEKRKSYSCKAPQKISSYSNWINVIKIACQPGNKSKLLRITELLEIAKLTFSRLHSLMQYYEIVRLAFCNYLQQIQQGPLIGTNHWWYLSKWITASSWNLNRCTLWHRHTQLNKIPWQIETSMRTSIRSVISIWESNWKLKIFFDSLVNYSIFLKLIL